MSTTAKALVDVARSQLSVGCPGKYNKYGQWYGDGMSGNPWCAIFVSWCAAYSGNADVIPKHAYTPSGVAWFKARGQYRKGIAGIRPGDIVYYDFPPKQRIQHVGIVEMVGKGGIYVIEGNTSSKNQSNGGCVQRKWRTVAGGIDGYGRPAYANSGSSTGSSTPAQNQGYSKDWMRKIQEKLNRLGYGLEVDGLLGPKTGAATKDFQSKNGLEVDGVPGQNTNAKLDQVLAQPSSGRPNCSALQGAVRAVTDNIWGEDTDKRLLALRAASLWGGKKFPYGVKFTQNVVGTPADGIWGTGSKTQHDRTTVNVQDALRNMGFNPGSSDGMWGYQTEAAFQAARKACKV